MSDPKPPLLIVTRPDPLKYFSRDGPWFRLAALAMVLTARVVIGATAVAAIVLYRLW